VFKGDASEGREPRIKETIMQFLWSESENLRDISEKGRRVWNQKIELTWSSVMKHTHNGPPTSVVFTIGLCSNKRVTICLRTFCSKLPSGTKRFITRIQTPPPSPSNYHRLRKRKTQRRTVGGGVKEHTFLPSESLQTNKTRVESKGFPMCKRVHIDFSILQESHKFDTRTTFAVSDSNCLCTSTSLVMVCHHGTRAHIRSVSVLS